MAQTNRKSKTKKNLNSQNVQEKSLSRNKSETNGKESENNNRRGSGSVNVVARRRIELYWEKKRLISEIGGVENLDDIDF